MRRLLASPKFWGNNTIIVFIQRMLRHYITYEVDISLTKATKLSESWAIGNVCMIWYKSEIKNRYKDTSGSSVNVGKSLRKWCFIKNAMKWFLCEDMEQQGNQWEQYWTDEMIVSWMPHSCIYFFILCQLYHFPRMNVLYIYILEPVQVLAATPHTAPTVRPPTTYHENHTS